MIGVYGEVGECVLMGDMDMLNGECRGGVGIGGGGLAAGG